MKKTTIECDHCHETRRVHPIATLKMKNKLQAVKLLIFSKEYLVVTEREAVGMRKKENNHGLIKIFMDIIEETNEQLRKN